MTSRTVRTGMAYATVAAGVALTALYLFGGVDTMPYSLFALMGGAVLIVDGGRWVRDLRRRRDG